MTARRIAASVPRIAAIEAPASPAPRVSSCNRDRREDCVAQDRRGRADAYRRRFADGTSTALRCRGVDPYRNEGRVLDTTHDRGVAFVATMGLAAFALAAVLA